MNIFSDLCEILEMNDDVHAHFYCLEMELEAEG